MCCHLSTKVTSAAAVAGFQTSFSISAQNTDFGCQCHLLQDHHRDLLGKHEDATLRLQSTQAHLVQKQAEVFLQAFLLLLSKALRKMLLPSFMDDATG